MRRIFQYEISDSDVVADCKRMHKGFAINLAAERANRGESLRFSELDFIMNRFRAVYFILNSLQPRLVSES